MEKEVESRIAIIGILVYDLNSAQKVNEILHDFSDVIIGRMGIPYQKRNVSIISVAVDGSMDRINSLTGKLGLVHGVSSKALWR